MTAVLPPSEVLHLPAAALHARLQGYAVANLGAPTASAPPLLFVLDVSLPLRYTCSALLCACKIESVQVGRFD